MPAPASAAPLPIGAPLPADRASDVNMADVLAEPDRYQGKPLTVRGVVTAVCQTRGCWLELAPEGAKQGAARGCRVVSENHDWFVPHDAAGSIARVQGRLEVRTISAAQVQHMESEGGRFDAKLPDGTARELRMVASGVELAQK